MKLHALKRILGGLLAVSILVAILPFNVVFAASGQDVVNYAYDTWKGTPWKKRGSVSYAPGVGVDCSALMQYAYNHYGYALSSSTYTQRYEGININHAALKSYHDYSLLQPGDLIFFNNYEHVGMYAGNGYFVHTSYTRGVVRQTLYGDGYNWHQYACEVRRIITGSSPVHTHSWSYANDSGHPHREYRTCACGEKQYTGTRRQVTSCRQCYPLGSVSLMRSYGKTARDVTLYRNAVLNANSYTLVLYRNGSSYGTYSMPETSKYISNLASGTYTATLTARNTNTGQSISVTCNSFTIVDTYDVLYDANGGTNAPAAQIKIKDTNLTITSAVPSRTGYVFQGWAPNSTATEPQYLPGGTYTKNTKITLYAVWKPEVYTIQFDANGGRGEVESTTITYGDSMKMPNAVIKDGYYLKGWAQTQSAAEPEYRLGMDYKLTANMTLYAMWGQSTWGGTVAAEFAGGDGTQENPYQISNAAELAHLADVVNNQQSVPEYRYYILTDNINLGYEEWLPIGLYGHENQYFYGSFDGNGYTVSDLYMSNRNEGYVGLFGYAKDSEIKNLTVSGDITGVTGGEQEEYIGAVLAYADQTNIDGCHISYVNISDITTKDTFCIGGICGLSNGVITNCTANECYISVKEGDTPDFAIGHIAGSSVGAIADCSVRSTEELFGAVGKIGLFWCGGICGAGGPIERCSVNAGSLINNLTSANLTSVGGIVGYANGSVNLCSVQLLNGPEKTVDNKTVKSSIFVDSVGGMKHDFAGGIVGHIEDHTVGICNSKYTGQSIMIDRAYAGHYNSAAVGGIVGRGVDGIGVQKSFSLVDGMLYSGVKQNDFAYAGGTAGRIANVSNSIAIADLVMTHANSWLENYSGDIAGNSGAAYDNVYSYSSMEVVAENIYDPSLAHTNTIGAKRTLTQMQRASFLNQVYGPAYRSLDYLKENPDAVWVIRDGEYPELYFNLLRDITLSATENGKITADKTQAIDGELVTVNAVPDEGYVLNTIYVNGQEIVGNTFLVSGDCDIYATFAKQTAEYQIQAAANENASATLVNMDDTAAQEIALFSDSTMLSAADGDEIRVNTAPSQDYTVDSIYVNGEELAGDSFIVAEDSVVTMDVTSISTEIGAVTYDAADIKGNAATLGGRVDDTYENASRYILYWRADTPDEVYTTQVEEGGGEYQVMVTDLELYTEYQYQMTENGDIKSFFTEYEHFDDSGISPPESKEQYFVISNIHKGDDIVAAEIVNQSETVQSGVMLFAAYNQSGALISIQNMPIEGLDAGGRLPCEFDLPAEAASCKFFIWDSHGGMRPLADSIRI